MENPGSSKASKILAKIPYFASLEPQVMQDLSSAAIQRSYDAGQVIFVEGEPCSGLYVVQEGWLKMDGVATIDKIQLSMGKGTLNGMYVMVQQVNWWSLIAWAVFISNLLGRKAWSQPLGIFAGLMAALGGYPLAMVSTMEVGRFSMFAPSPLLSTLLVVILMLPVVRKLIDDWTAGKLETSKSGKVFAQAANKAA